MIIHQSGSARGGDCVPGVRGLAGGDGARLDLDGSLDDALALRPQPSPSGE